VKFFPLMSGRRNLDAPLAAPTEWRPGQRRTYVLALIASVAFAIALLVLVFQTT
jgi:hypothetical protein